MKQLFIKLYDLITAPLYRRLARDLTIQLQEISQSYIDQHERLTGKMVDELLKMHVRLDNHEYKSYARDSAFSQSPLETQATGGDLSPEKIYELMVEAASSIDTIELCRKHDISLATYVQLESKYRGCDPDSIRRARMLEATNFELTRLIASLLRERDERSQPGNGDNKGLSNDAVTVVNTPDPVATESGNGSR